MAGLTRIYDKCTTKSLIFPPTDVGIEQEYWQSLSYLPSTAQATSDKIKARI